MQSIQRLAGNLFSAEPPAYSQQLINESDTQDEDYLRNASSNRTHTDVPFLVLQGGFLFALVFFLAYCITYGDIERLTKGHDSCGNVCGKLNTFDLDFETHCKAEDMRNKPYLSLNGFDSGECVATCEVGSIVIFGHRCISGGNIQHDDDRDFNSYNIISQQYPISNRFKRDNYHAIKDQSFINQISRDLHTCSAEIVYMCFIALALAFVILLILRYLTAAFVWTVLIGIVLGCASVTGFFWYLTGKQSEFTPLAILFSIGTFIVLLVIMILRKRIQLVIQLFKEAGKSITGIPLLLFEPLLTFVSLAIVWAAWLYFTLWIESAGIPTATGSGIEFRKNGLMEFSRWYNHFVMVWMVQFIYGCQNMLLAGAISTWYFTRNKSQLGRPIYYSVYNMMKYHLGTISFGSLIIALIHTIKLLFRSMRRGLRYLLFLCCMCCVYKRIEECFNYLEQFMKYLTRNAYIITAIHGYPFMESGTKAFKLLVENALRVLAINSVGDFVLVLAKLLVVVATVACGVLLTQEKEHVENKWAPVVIGGIVAYLIAHCFLTVYEMAIDTIFICFCEDCEINDGYSRPYFMSHGLMEFVEKSRSVLGIQLQPENANNPVVLNNPVIVSVTQNNR